MGNHLRGLALAACACLAIACGSGTSTFDDARTGDDSPDASTIVPDAQRADARAPDAASPDAIVPLDGNPCGNGVIDSGEQCDEGVGNGASCCTASCTLLAPFTECRAAVDDCDVAEACDGVSGACPADAVAQDSTPCAGNGESTCSGADTCGGGVCMHNDTAPQTACGDEPTCQPAACDGSGGCVDTTTVDDGTACTERGGTLCCGAHCSIVPSGGDCSTCVLGAHGAQRITIIESQSASSAHNMDQRWSDIATPLGHTVTIAPQETLDDLANLADTDILIVSSGVLDLTQTRRDTIEAFAASHRGVYLQSEYLTSYATNQTLAQIINAHGSTFAWVGTVVGQQDPVTVSGCLASTAEASTSLTAYWYAATGNAGPEVQVIHTAPGGQPIAWSYCLPGGGLVISNTDQDFIRDLHPGTPEHMRNVLLALADAPSCQ